MTHKTKTIKNEHHHETTEVPMQTLALSQADQDAKNAVLIVSLMANAFVLIGWVTLQVTSIYDAQVAAFLFSR